MTNANKFTEKGLISIKFDYREKHVDGEAMLIGDVIDTGVGIEASDRDKIFLPFSTFNN